MVSKRKFTREFKIALIHEMECGKTTAEISREHQILPTMLYKWKTQYKQNPEEAFAGNGKICTLEAKLAERDRLIGTLYAENAFLKKVLSNLETRLMEHRNQR